jgi:nicotinate-nucleotide adenylyltransferase
MQGGNVKYAIFGGSFDPPHLGHTAVAQAVLDHLQLDEVIWVPNARNPLRRPAIASVTERLQMCQLATENHPGMAVSDVEVSRPGRSYTIDTVAEFQLVNPGQIWIILGADSVNQFMEWKDAEKLSRMSRLAVVVRPGTDLETAIHKLPEDVQDTIDIVPMNENRISSTQVRDSLLRGISAEMWLEPTVWQYMEERGLYRGTESK